MAQTNTKAETTTGQTATAPNMLNRVRLGAAALVSLLAFFLYVGTLAPTVTLVDSGELILATRSLGVAHPPGFPLYLLLAHLATYIPVGALAVRIHLLSALCGALAAGLLTLLVSEAILSTARHPLALQKIRHSRKKAGRASSGKPAAAHDHDESETRMASIVVPSLLAGLLFAASRTIWSYSTIAEVYTLNTFLILLVCFMMVRWRRKNTPSIDHGRSYDDRWLFAAAFVFGLGLAVHHVTVGLLLPALAAFVLATEGWRFFTGKRLLYAALFAILGLSLYLYLPFAASRSPLMNWGDPRTLERFWWHVTGKQYQVFFDLSFARISEFFRLTLREYGYTWLPLPVFLSLVGFVYLFKRDRGLFLLLSLVVVFDVLYCLGYEIDEDKDAYYLPAFVALVVAAAFGARWLLLRLQTPALRRVPLAVLFLCLAILPLLAVAGNFPYNNRSRYYVAHDYVTNILNTVEPGGMLLTNDWQVYSPFLYLHHLENTRQDVVAIDVNQLRRSWYFDYLQQVYPDLIGRSQDKVSAFVEDLKNWEQNPDAYAQSAALAQRINTRFYDMILSFISNHNQSSPVYVTQDVALNRGGPNQELTTALTEKYKLIPLGLIFRVSESAQIPAADEKPLLTRGLADGTLKFEADDVVMQKVFPVYLAMLTNRGRYLALQNQHEKAIEYYRRALALDAAYEPAKRALAASPK